MRRAGYVFSAVVAAVVIVLLGSLQITHAADFPATGGYEQVTVTGVAADATLQLGQGAQILDTQIASGTSFTFTNVEPGIEYYVIQTAGGVVTSSNMVTVNPAAVNATGGAGYIDVTGGKQGRTLTLYRVAGNEVAATYTLAAGETGHRFDNLAGTFYVVQSVNSLDSQGSAFAVAVPKALTVSGGIGYVDASGGTPGVSMRLMRVSDNTQTASYTLGAAETSHRFESVAGVFYIIQTSVDNVQDGGSTWATATPPQVTAIGSASGQVSVTGAMPGAALTLYYGAAQQTTGTADGAGGYTFTGLQPGTGYSVTQTVDSVTGAASAAVTVTPAAPAAVGGAMSLTVSGLTGGAQLKLYQVGTPTPLVSATAGVADTEYTFTNVQPGFNYYATQTVGGVESVNTNWVTVKPDVVAVSGGSGYIDVSGALSGATLQLYRTPSAYIASHTLSVAETTYRFSGIAGEYYVIQNKNGAESLASSFATATPPAFTLTGGAGYLDVSGAMPGGTVKLYLLPSILDDQATLTVTDSAYRFNGKAGVYYAIQTVNGTDSPATPFATATPLAVTLSGGVESVTVSGATPGSKLKLYVGSSQTAEGVADSGGAYRFTGIAAGMNYYVTQTVHDVEGLASNTVTVSPGGFGAIGAIGQVQVTGAAKGALLKLYRGQAELTASFTLQGDDTAYTFTGVTPGFDYYVTQTVGGVESLGTSFVVVDPAPGGLAARGGVNTVEVAGASAGAMLSLYNGSGQAVASRQASVTGATYGAVFSPVQPGVGYYVVQTIGGIPGAPSNTVTVKPEAVSAGAGYFRISVTGASPAAEVKLYREGTALASGIADTLGSYVFAPVAAGGNYTVTQTVYGAESDPTGALTVIFYSSSSSSNAQPDQTSGSEQTAGGDSAANADDELASARQTKEDGQNVVTMTVDPLKLDERLKTGDGTVITLTTTGGADKVVGVLNAQMIKNMENRNAVLEIRTDNAVYTLPAAALHIEHIADQVDGAAPLAAIEVSVVIGKSGEAAQQRLAEQAGQNGWTVAAPPVDFTMYASLGVAKVEIGRFDQYVTRSLALPAGTDPAKITTGVVLEADGSVRHVPTKVEKHGETYYALINSLTNSSYAVIWNPKSFTDVSGHWSKQAVDDMGSRLVVAGVSDTSFAPDRSVTRGEFAAIVARALGLGSAGAASGKFSDVPESHWAQRYGQAAYEYRLIDGYPDGTFRPEQTITRSEAFVIVHRAMTLTGLLSKLSDGLSGQLDGFADSGEIRPWARDAAAAVLAGGVFEGDGGQLNPSAELTRAQSAAAMLRLLKQSGLI
ncbi:S-layer homology domain-containing protein [Paenibacillus thalictri]|uniref:S-layer homology domain-containing protein n=1 Tax=Paenibacillus thalictri TaxID=2527873 RepID=A0A4Q9DUJ2_9BACL|nr:S-layer homology domain-containing protein [Paenibacillus thalictri]TBL79353.1 S-layer homology domain-containing protein [Paenibacillus thalictri]